MRPLATRVIRRLEIGTAHGLVLDCPGPGELQDQALALLDPDERARVAAFSSPGLAAPYAAAHLALRELVTERAGPEAGRAALVRHPCPACGAAHGRPAVAGFPDLHVSLSHTAGLVGVAVADRPVGIDVERVPGQEAVADVQPRLHPVERAAVASAGRPTTELARIWTRKEALLKGYGTGLSRPLDADDVTGVVPGWEILDEHVDDTHWAALAVAGRPDLRAQDHLEPR